METTFLGALIGGISAIIAAIIGRVRWKRRKKIRTHAFMNAFQAGWGLGRLVDEWINLEGHKISPNFLGMISQIQPYYDALKLNVNLLDSFKKGKFPDDFVPFTFEMKSKISAEFGMDAGYALELGQCLVLNTKAVHRYATDSSYRKKMENQGMGLDNLIAPLDEPLRKLHLGKKIEKEWSDIISSIKANQFDKDELWPTIQTWIEKVYNVCCQV